MRITRAKRKPPAFCREVRTGFCGLFGKITAFSAKMILKRTVLWYTFCAKPMILVDRIVALRCRSPCGERGLKCQQTVRFGCPSRRSPCGERGLKLQTQNALWTSWRRSPCGERGLKWLTNGVLVNAFASLPVRGAWVEMPWSRRVSVTRSRRSPCGERGLKCDLHLDNCIFHCVAPRAGSVG